MRRQRGDALPLHPFLFAAVSVLAQYASNFREMYFSDALASLVGALCFAAIVFTIFAAALRRDPARAAVLATIVVAPSLYYVDLIRWLNRQVGTSFSPEAALPVAVLAVILLIVAVWRVRFRMALPNTVLNGIAVVMFAVPGWNIGEHQWRASQMPSHGHQLQPGDEAGAAAAALPAGEKPDIYYLIFDRYGSEETLANVFDFDNGPFVRFLEEKGFYVASDSHSNYLKTAPSVASSLNMEYLDFAADDPRVRRNDWHPIYDMIEGEHRVGRFVTDAGYSFVNIGGWWNPTQHNPLADENYSFGLSEFGWLYLRRTIAADADGRDSAGERAGAETAMGQRPVPARSAAIREAGGDRRAAGAHVHLRPYPASA